MKTVLLAFALMANAWADMPGDARQQELLNLLKHDCGSCHGLTLKGGLGPSLLAEAISGKPDSFLLQTILNGRKGTPMPPWRDFINASEAAWLVENLRRRR